MTYFANEILDNFIIKRKRESVLAVLFGVFFYCMLCSAFYYNFSLLVFRINLFVVGVFTIFYEYSVIVMNGKKLNKIVNEMSIDNEITLTTYSYRFLFYNIESKNYTFNKDDLKFEKSVPLFKSKELNVENTICLTINDDKIYILIDFFSDNLKENLGISML